MNTSKLYPRYFYLGFDKETGELMDVIAPDQKKVKIHPGKYREYHKGQMKIAEKEDFEIHRERLEILIKRSKEKFKEQKLEFADDPGNSVCGGSVGGIPFSWCS